MICLYCTRTTSRPRYLELEECGVAIVHMLQKSKSSVVLSCESSSRGWGLQLQAFFILVVVGYSVSRIH